MSDSRTAAWLTQDQWSWSGIVSEVSEVSQPRHSRHLRIMLMAYSRQHPDYSHYSHELSDLMSIMLPYSALLIAQSVSSGHHMLSSYTLTHRPPQ